MGRVCGPAHKPEELLDDTAEEGALGGEQGKRVVREGKTERGRGEEGEGACACTVWPWSPCVEDASDEVEVLVLWMRRGH